MYNVQAVRVLILFLNISFRIIPLLMTSDCVLNLFHLNILFDIIFFSLSSVRVAQTVRLALCGATAREARKTFESLLFELLAI